MVEAGAAIGLTEEELCMLIPNPKTGKPINKSTLYDHFTDELKGGHVKANIKVGAGLFKNATTPTGLYPGGNPICQIFWMKCRQRWRQTFEGELLPQPPDEVEEIDLELARRMAFYLELAARRKSAPKALPEAPPAAARRREYA